MNQKNKEVVSLVKKMKAALGGNDTLELRKVSNSAIERVMLTRQPKLVEISLISYGLSKILGKPHYLENPDWNKFKREIEKELEKTEEKRGKKLEKTIKIIYDFSEDAGNYIEGVIDHGRIKQASRLYALGLSLDSAAEMTKVREDRLLEYIGATKISEKTHTISKPIKKRYSKTKEILKEGKE